MGADRAVVAAAAPRWSPGEASASSDRGRGLVCVTDRVLVASVAGGLPAWQTVYWYFVAWEAQKVTHAMLAALRGELRTH